MCFDSLAWATKQELPAMQKIVLVMLADHNSKSGLCFPSYDTLAVECGMTKRSTINQVGKLESAGLLTIERAANRSNRYTLNIPASESLSLGSESLSLGSESLSPEPVNNQSLNLKNIVVVTHEEILKSNCEQPKELSDLTSEELECWNWAMTVTFWASTTTSVKKFLSVYRKQNEGGLASQFNAHKKARETWNVNGLNSENSFTNKTGGNYASNTKFNQPSKLSAVDRSKQACQRMREEWNAQHNVIDI